MQEKQRISDQYQEVYAAVSRNRSIIQAVEKRKEDMIRAEKKYVWVKALSDTAGGTLNQKQKVDVYKRQDYYIDGKRIAAAAVDVSDPAQSCLLYDSISVSYTHLDVYKRQAQHVCRPTE